LSPPFPPPLLSLPENAEESFHEKISTRFCLMNFDFGNSLECKIAAQKCFCDFLLRKKESDFCCQMGCISDCPYFLPSKNSSSK
jgi:hypothetical protein